MRELQVLADEDFKVTLWHRPSSSTSLAVFQKCVSDEPDISMDPSARSIWELTLDLVADLGWPDALPATGMGSSARFGRSLEEILRQPGRMA